MNVERIRQLADIIEKQPHTDISDKRGFNMDDFDHVCGTPACIAGWAIERYSPISNKGADLYSRKVPLGEGFSSYASKLLELSPPVGEDLFFGHGSSLRLNDITPAHAAAVLRNLADTSEVDWSVGAPVDEPA